MEKRIQSRAMCHQFVYENSALSDSNQVKQPEVTKCRDGPDILALFIDIRSYIKFNMSDVRPTGQVFIYIHICCQIQYRTVVGYSAQHQDRIYSNFGIPLTTPFFKTQKISFFCSSWKKQHNISFIGSTEYKKVQHLQRMLCFPVVER